jgi:poly(3-hydroxybutyrate) depolymerase
MCNFKVLSPRTVGLVIAAAAILAFAKALPANEIQTGFQERIYQDERGVHKYIVFVPTGYTPEQKWPVILYLHGASARGTDNRVQIVGGLGTQINARIATFPFLVVFPQCEERDPRVFSGWESDSADGQRALRILDAVENEFNVDRSREALTGWSMGGFGAWNLAASCPERWSAVVIVAGEVDLSKASKLKNVRVWSFHGNADFGVPIDRARQMIDAIRQAGGNPYLTELPGVGHNIGHVVYCEDALYNWLLTPQEAPQSESFVRNAGRKPTKAEMGRDFEFPFVPAVEVPNAFYIRLDNSVLESIGYAIPAMVPETALSGAVADVRQTSRGVIAQFDVQLSGLNYRGELEQVRIVSRQDGWVTLQFGLRNVTFQISQTSVTGVFAGATAGPMQIVVGQREPIWITTQVRPYVEDRRLRLQMGETRVQIQDDNLYVTNPSVVGNGLPLLRNRVADSVSRKMVSDAYGRKQQIEAQLQAAVPQLLAQMETKLQEKLSTPRIVGSKLPGPSYMPRCILWPEKVKVDETGLAMTLGITLSRPGLNPPKVPLHRIAGSQADFDEFPKTAGMQLAVSGAVCDGMTEACSNSAMTTADVRELGVHKLFELGDRAIMTEVIPDLARFGDRLLVRSHFELAGPVSFCEAPKAGGTQGDGPGTMTQLKLSDLRMVVQIKTSPDQQAWTRCAEFDIQMDYLARMWVGRPNFERRTFITDMASDPNVKVTARFADGYDARNPTLRNEDVAKIFATGWREEGPTQFLHGLCRESPAKDLELGSARVRLATATWRNSFVFLEYRLPRTRITNASDRPIEYQIRGLLTNWGGPFALAPGKSHEFPVPYPMIFRQGTSDGLESKSLPLGTDFQIGPSTAASSVMGTDRQ